MDALRFSAGLRPAVLTQQPAPTAVKFGAEGETDGFSAAKGAKRAGSIAHWGALGALFLGLFTANGLIGNNPAGKHSLVFDKLSGGFEETVHDDGPVWLGLKGLVGMRNNVSVDTTELSVRECIINPPTQDNKPNMPPLCIRVNFKLPVENLHTLFTQKLGDFRQNVTLNPEETVFLKGDDPVAQRFYVQLIRNSVRGMANAITPNVRGDNFYKIAPLLAQAFNGGIKEMKVRKLDGGETTFSTPSLQELVGPLVKIVSVEVEDLEIPDDMEAKFRDRAKRPLETQIARIERDFAEVDARRRDAEERIVTVTREAEADWTGRIRALKETGLITVNEIQAAIDKIVAEGEQALLIRKREADRQASEIRAGGDRKAAEVLSTARQQSEQIKAQAEALVVRALELAKADQARLEGEPLSKYPELVQLEAVKLAEQVLKALGESSVTFRFLDPKTGLKLEMLNINNGSGTDATGIVQFLQGARAAKIVPQAPTDIVPPDKAKAE